MKDTTETVCQRNSSETVQQNLVKLCRNKGHNVQMKFWFIFFSWNYALFQLRNLTKMKDTTETVCQRNSSETAQQNFVKLSVVINDIMCRYAFYRKCWFDLFKGHFISLLNLNYFVQLRWNWFSVRLPVTNAWNCHSLFTAISSNVGAWGMWACSLFLSLWQLRCTIGERSLRMRKAGSSKPGRDRQT